MNSISNLIATRTESGFAMPVYAHLAVVTCVPTQSTLGRDAAARKSRAGFATIPGTSAWRPPIC